MTIYTATLATDVNSTHMTCTVLHTYNTLTYNARSVGVYDHNCMSCSDRFYAITKDMLISRIATGICTQWHIVISETGKPCLQCRFDVCIFTTKTVQLPNSASVLRSKLYSFTLEVALIHRIRDKNFVVSSDSVSSCQALIDSDVNLSHCCVSAFWLVMDVPLTL